MAFKYSYVPDPIKVLPWKSFTMIKRLTDPTFYEFFDWKKSLLLGLFLVFLEWLFLNYALNFDPLQAGDAIDYWNNSLNWRQPYNPFHVPGYPLTLAAVSGLLGT